MCVCVCDQCVPSYLVKVAVSAIAGINLEQQAMVDYWMDWESATLRVSDEAAQM